MKRKRENKKCTSVNLPVPSTDKTSPKLSSPDVENNSDMYYGDHGDVGPKTGKQDLPGDKHPDKGPFISSNRPKQGPAPTAVYFRARRRTSKNSDPRLSCSDGPLQIDTNLNCHQLGVHKQRMTRAKMKDSANSVPKVGKDDMGNPSSRAASITSAENIDAEEATTHEKKHKKGKRGVKSHKDGCLCIACTNIRRKQEREAREGQEACTARTRASHTKIGLSDSNLTQQEDDDEETESEDVMEVEKLQNALAQESRHKPDKNVYERDYRNGGTSKDLQNEQNDSEPDSITKSVTSSESSEKLRVDAQEFIEAAKRWQRDQASGSLLWLETPTPMGLCNTPFSNNPSSAGSGRHFGTGLSRNSEIHSGSNMAMDPKHGDVDMGLQDEQHLIEEGGQQKKRNTRGPTRGIRAKKNKIKDLHWTPLMQPYGTSLNEFKNYLGVLVKTNCDINLLWKQVDKATKDMMWADAQKMYNLPNDCKKKVMCCMSKRFRCFKHTLVSGYITCTRPIGNNDKQPWEAYDGMITKEQWERFYKSHTTPEWRALQEKCRKNQSRSIHKHYLGSKGYTGKIAEWKAAGLIPTSPDDSPSFTGKESVDRSIKWKLARLKKDEHGNYYFPDEKTKEVADRIDELLEEVAQGVWTPYRNDDVLSRALGKPDHPGHVNGYGGEVRIREVFGPRSGGIRMEEFKRLTAEMMERVKKETREEMDHLMESKVQNYLRQHQGENNFQQLPRPHGISQDDPSLQGTSEDNQDKPVEMPSHVANSHVSVALDDPYPFAFIQEMVRCRLALKISGSKEIIVAEGMLMTSNSTTAVHHEALLPYHAKVSVDRIMDGYHKFPLPVPSDEISTLEEAHRTYVQWPADLVHVDGQTPTLKKEEAKEDKGDGPRLTDASYTRPPIVSEQTVQLLGECVRQLHDYIMQLPLDIDSSRLLLDHETFHYEEDVESTILVEDIAQLMRRDWLSVSIIQAYIPGLVEKMNEHDIKPDIGFLCPERVSSIRAKAGPEELQKYMRNAFLRMKERKYILIPYRQNAHWILLVMCLGDDKLFVFDPLGKGKSKIEILRQIELAFHVHRVAVQKKRTQMKVCHMDCPRQAGGLECGYYVMRYMHDIVTGHSLFSDLEKAFNRSSYSEELIKEVLDDWAKYMYDSCSF